VASLASIGSIGGSIGKVVAIRRLWRMATSGAICGAY
jgi:hypothetical protein